MHATHIHTHAHTEPSIVFFLPLNSHAYPMTSSALGTCVLLRYWESMLVNPPGASQEAVPRLTGEGWASKVPPGSSPTMQHMHS